jgi:very-short-patch-repair endonuclease
MDKKMHAGAIKPLYQRARELRENSTQAEMMLWGYLKTKPVGFKFRRQHPYSIYILDFYCHILQLVFEVDGNIHDEPDVKLNDQQRQSLLENNKLAVLRFSNDQIEKEFEKTRRTIEEFLTTRKNEYDQQ